MSDCIRCGKTFFDTDDSIHTCTPTKQYRAGVVEGLKIARAVLPNKSSYFDNYNMTPFVDAIDELIKQHEGDE